MKLSSSFLFWALLAEIIGTIGGFGSSVFFVPIGNFYFDFYSVLGMTAVFHLSSNLSKIALFRSGLDKNMLLNIGLPSVVFVILGAHYSGKLDPKILELLLGIFLVAISLFFLIRKNFSFAPTRDNATVGGILSGFSAGLLGTGGAIRGLTMAAFNMEKSAFIATSAAIDLMIDLTRTVVYYDQGYVHESQMIYVPFLFAIGLIGSYIGKRILNHIPQEKFKKISLLLILLIGIISIIKQFSV